MEKTDIRENYRDSSEHFAFESAIVESKLFRNVEHADLPPPNDDVAESDKISHRRRPIALKAGLGVTKTDGADSKKPRERGTRRKKIGESGRRHRPIQLKADVGVINKDAPETKSVKKKMKQASFAANVNRDDIVRGAEDLGVDLDEHIQMVIDAMTEIADQLGLAGTSSS